MPNISCTRPRWKSDTISMLAKTAYLVGAFALLAVMVVCTAVLLLCVCRYVYRARRRRIGALPPAVVKDTPVRCVGEINAALQDELREQQMYNADYVRELRRLDRLSYENLRIETLKDEQAINETRAGKNVKIQRKSQRNRDVGFDDHENDDRRRTGEDGFTIAPTHQKIKHNTDDSPTVSPSPRQRCTRAGDINTGRQPRVEYTEPASTSGTSVTEQQLTTSPDDSISDSQSLSSRPVPSYGVNSHPDFIDGASPLPS